MRALYHHQFGAVKTFSSRTLRFVALVIAGLFVFIQASWHLNPALAYSYPSTHENNVNESWAHVVQKAVSTSDMTLEFFGGTQIPSDHVSCFEYRSDGDTSQDTGVVHPLHPQITDRYPHLCVNGSDSEERTISADDYVEVRSAFGAESDERFDWTRFDVLPDTTKPTISIDPMPPQFLSGTENFTITITDEELDPNDNKQIWVELYGVPDWSQKKGQKVNLSSGSGIFEVDTTTLLDGKYVLRVGSVEDATGNKSGDKSFSPFTVDNTAPESANFVQPTPGDLVSGTTTVEVAISDAGAGLGQQQIVMRKPDGTIAGNWTYNVATGISNIIAGPATTFDYTGDAHSGNLKLTFDTNNLLGDGQYNLRLFTKDKLGNGRSNIYSNFVVDNTAPVVTVTPIAGSLLSGTVTFEITVTDDNLNPNAPKTWVYLYNTAPPQKQKGEKIDLSDGHGTFTVDTKLLDDGNSSLNVGKLFDAAGNASGPKDTYFRNYIIDNTGPTAPQIVFPSDGQYFTSSPILNDWTEATDVNGIDYYQIAYNYDDGHTFGGSTCPGLTISGLTGFIGCRDLSATQRNHSPNTSEQGGVTILVRAFDNAGNASDWSTSVHYIYDSVPPAKVEGLKFVDDDGDVTDGNTNDYYVAAHWNTISDANKYEYCYWNDIATSTYNEGNCYTTFPTTNSQSGVFNQGEGLHYIKVRAIDAAGNLGPWSDTLEILYDATKPVTVNPLTSPNNDTAWNGAIPIAGETTDDNGVNFIDIYAKPAGSDDSNYQHITTVDNPSDNSPFNWTFDWTPSAEGAYDIKAAGTDIAGNVESSGYALAIVFDQTAPAVAIDPITTGDTQVDGTVDNDAVSVEVSFDNGTTWSPATYTLGDTTWTAPIPALSSGAHTVLARATDAASNVTTPPAEENFEIGESGNVLACVIMQDQTVVCDDDNSSASQDNQRVLGDTDGEVLAATGQGGWLMTTLGSVIMGLALATRLSRKKA